VKLNYPLTVFLNTTTGINKTSRSFIFPGAHFYLSLHRICSYNGGGGIMRMHEFQLLSQDEQIAILYQEGIYVGKKKAGKITTLLYQLASFYVEIIYASYRRAIQTLIYSESTTVLDPYLEQIPIEYLVT
jgi:hypothetical protein